MQLPNVRSPKLEIDLPVLNKFLFCLPLRPGILACGYLQLVTVVLISGSAIAKFAQEVPYRNGYQLVQIIILFMMIMIWNLLDAIFAVFQIIGAQKKLANFLEVVYHYLRAKVLLFAGFLIVSVFMKEFVVSDSWYYYNLDPWFNYCLMDNLAMGALAWIANFYLLLLVRSELIKLEHPIDFSTLYQRLYTPSELPEKMSQDSKPAADAC